MTYVLAAVMCLNCASEMIKQGGRIYFCPSCRKYFRLKGMVPILEPATYEDAQLAIAKAVAEEGLVEVVG